MQERCDVSSCCAAAVALPQSGKAICDLRGCRREECTRSARAKKRTRIFALLFFPMIISDGNVPRMIISEED
jgi:hypothetical protein